MGIIEMLNTAEADWYNICGKFTVISMVDVCESWNFTGCSEWL